METTKPSLLPFGLSIGGAVAAFALLIALSPSGAGAATAQCTQSSGTVRSDGALGEVNKVIVGYRKRDNQLRVINRAQLPSGVRDITDVVCPNDQRWHWIVLRLRDKNDTVRLTGRDPVMRGYKKVPRTIAVRVNAGSGNDQIFGHHGRDHVNAGADRDRVRTFKGNDWIKGGNGRDRIWAGPGKDEIHVDDGNKDFVDCGPGTDIVYADPRDVLVNCERIR